YMDELKELSQTLNIHHRIAVVGPVSQAELSKWYSQGDIFVYPSLYENFGQPILEAAAAGLPIISTSVGVAKEIIKDNETGFIFNGKSQELADRINLLKDHNLRKKMGSAVKEKVRKLFGWEKVINQYINLYQSL
ncbi:MAG: glycosyltransferase family 4 protein, partial [Nitrospinaceae bacterium]